MFIEVEASQEVGDKEAFRGGVAMENLHGKSGLAPRPLEGGQWGGECGLCVHCPLPEPWAGPPWQHAALRPAFHRLEPSRRWASFWPELGCVAHLFTDTESEIDYGFHRNPIMQIIIIFF